MNTSNRAKAAIAIIAALTMSAEGLRHYAYRDPGGILTVCYGHTGPDVVAGRFYPLAECRALFDKDMLNAITIVEQCRPGLPEPVLAAFADAVYNIGPRVACDSATSTAARYLAAGDWRRACDELPRWNKARVAGQHIELPGLTKRRAMERDICLTGVV